jgi:ubiquitin C-terminal hydrolase
VCNHRGSLNGGHWLTKELTETGWYELDDLKTSVNVTNPPGLDDTSVVVLLLIAEDKL